LSKSKSQKWLFVNGAKLLIVLVSDILPPTNTLWL